MMRFWVAMIALAVLVTVSAPVLADGLCPAIDGAAVDSETLNDTRTTLKCKYELTGTLRDIQCVSRFNAGLDGNWALQSSRVNAEDLQVCKYELLESHYLPEAEALIPAAFRGAR